MKSNLTVSQTVDGAASFLTSVGFGYGDIELFAEDQARNEPIPMDAEIMLRFNNESGQLVVRVGIVMENDLEAMRVLAVGRAVDYDVDILGKIAALAYRWSATVCLNACGFTLSR